MDLSIIVITIIIMMTVSLGARKTYPFTTESACPTSWCPDTSVRALGLGKFRVALAKASRFRPCCWSPTTKTHAWHRSHEFHNSKSFPFYLVPPGTPTSATSSPGWWSPRGTALHACSSKWKSQGPSLISRNTIFRLIKVWDRNFTVQTDVEVDAEVDVIIKMKQPIQQKLGIIPTYCLDRMTVKQGFTQPPNDLFIRSTGPIARRHPQTRRCCTGKQTSDWLLVIQCVICTRRKREARIKGVVLQQLDLHHLDAAPKLLLLPPPQRFLITKSSTTKVGFLVKCQINHIIQIMNMGRKAVSLLFTTNEMYYNRVD